MLSTYEIITTSNVNDIRLFLQRVSSFPLHWHQAMEFLLILEGKCIITINDTEYEYYENDIVLINSFDPHKTYSEDGCTILTLQINNVDFASNKRFDINSLLHKNENYDDIKIFMAKMIKIYNEASPNNEYLLQSLLLMLKYLLLTNYIDHNQISNHNVKSLNKLSNIIDYLQHNYKYELSLSNVANKFFYSPSYLSRDFNKTLGISFKKYIDNLRLSEAVNLLLTTNNSINQIALESGFANTRSFVSLHRQTYGCLPSEHRKSLPKKEVSPDKEDNYFELKQTDYLSKLAVFLNKSNNELLDEIENRNRIDYLDIDCDGSSKVKFLKHTFKKFITVGKASDILKSNIRDMLKTAQDEIGFKYIKFHGILDDDLNVYYVNEKNEEVFNFTNVDNVIDYLLSIDLYPLIQLSFMPRALAKYPNKSVFVNRSYTSEPTSIDKWVNLVKKFMYHLINRYSINIVNKFLFCCWNEAELSSNLFGFTDYSIFPEFYQRTYLACKEVCPSIMFGSTSMLYSSILNGTMEHLFFSNPNTHPDFINVHFYPIKKDKGLLTVRNLLY